MAVNACRPTSRGSIAIRANDPFTSSLIAPDYLPARNDIAEALAGAKLLRRLAAARPLSEVIAPKTCRGRTRCRTTSYLHPEKVMHDRFVLTDRGGIQIGHGLDDNEDGGNAPTAIVVLLEQAMFQIQWQRFSADGSLVLRLGP